MAIARAAIEAERERGEPRFTEFRFGALLVALDERSADYAAHLAAVADRLADADPLLPPARVLEELGAIDPPEGISGLTPARLVQLAAAASTKAAASSRLEIYPRAMPAERALRLAQGALLGARHLTMQELRDRVAGRYPEAERLPERPELDGLLRRADLGFEWDPQALDGRGAYRPHAAVIGPVSSSTTIWTRSTGAEGAQPAIDENVQRFDERLRYALGQGSFLALGVPPKYLLSAERRLTRKFPVRPASLEALLVTEMKKAALQAGAQWTVVRDADAAGPSGPHWLNLLRIVGRAVTAMEGSLMRSDQPVLLGYPGLLARYDRLDLLEHLRDRSGNRNGPPGVWLLSLIHIPSPRDCS